MLNFDMKRKINTLRDILVGKIPDPKSQVEQITIAMIYKFMDDMDTEFIGEWGGERKFFVKTNEVNYEQYAWSFIMSPTLSGEKRSELYREGIEAMPKNPNLPELFRNVFRNAYIPFRDSETINMFLKEVDDFKYDNSEDLGNAFEMLLSIMGSQGDAGQFRTPRHIIDMIVDIIEPHKNDSISYPACGTAGFLISAFKHILNENRDKDGKVILSADEKTKLTNNLVGYDISQDMVRLSRVNMYLHNFPDPKIYEYDTLTSQDRWDDQFDVILANPPFMTPKGGINPHNRFSVQAKRSEVLFVDYIAEHLNPNGRAGIIVPEGIVFQTANAYKDLRKMLVDNDYLYAVISLPAGVFNPYSGVKTSVLLFDKALAKKTDKVLFVKIDSDGFDLGAQRREISINDIPRTVELVKKFKATLVEGSEFELSEYENEFAVLAGKEDIKGQDYILVGERYREQKEYNHTKWINVEIGEMFEINYGIAVSIPQNIDDNGIKIISTAEIELNGSLNLSKIRKISWDDNYLKYFLKPQTLLFNWRNAPNHVGKTAIFDKNEGEYIYASFLLSMVAKCPEKIHIKFAWAMINSLREKGYFLRNSRQAVNQTNFNAELLRSTKIPLPPLFIQQQIVDEIESYQKIIDGARQVVENYKPTIKIDPEWEMVELGEITKIISGFAFSSDDFTENEGVRVIKITNIGVKEFIEDSMCLPASFGDKYCRYLAVQNDIAIAMTRPYISSGLKICIVPPSYNESLVNQRTAVIRNIENKTNYHYIYYIMMSDFVYEYVVEKSKSLNQPNLSIKDLERLQIPLPNIDTQKQIVEKINEEVSIVQQNKCLIEIFEQKINDKISEVWGGII